MKILSTISCLATVIILLSMGMVSLATPKVCDRYCHPGQSCWPSFQDEVDFYQSVGGRLKTAFDTDYGNLTVMINTRVTKLPYIIVLAGSVDDVIKTVKFANKYNIRITVRSSGHDYIGRSTADGSIQINLQYMKGIQFNMSSYRHPDGEVTVESGNTWLRVYNETSKMGRVIVGGSAHTVSMGGYTLGGGHSPIGRKFGLAVDNLLEVKMVSANASLVTANEQGTTIYDTETGHVHWTSNNDIFWAVRGGGGSTYGIVVSFTFKLHQDSKMVVLTCVTPVYDETGQNVGRQFIEKFNNLLATTLAPEWGGYELISGQSLTNTTRGSITLFLNHFGEWGSPSFNTINPMLPMCKGENVSNFLEYEIKTYDPLYYRNYIFNTLVQPESLTSQFYDYMYSMFNDSRVPVGCTGVLVGGNMNNVSADSTSVNPYLRSGIVSLTCGLSWGSAFEDEFWIPIAEKFSAGLMKYGKGVYYNEPSAHLPNWKMDYWGGHYDRLLAIKRQWDPSHVFTCYHCVGSDETPTDATSGQNAQNHNIPIIPFPSIIS